MSGENETISDSISDNISPWRDKRVWSWMMYDWANSAFATTIIAAIFPIYFDKVISQGLSDNVRGSLYPNIQAVAALIVAFLAPFLGAIADHAGAKKKFLGMFFSIGVTATLLFFFAREGNWVLGSAIFILSMVGFSGANIFYDAFLPEIASDEHIDQISTWGYAFGYIGGGVLLAINAFMLANADDGAAISRWCFVSVAIWWFFFSMPLFIFVKEPQRTSATAERNYVKIAFKRLGKTFQEIRKYRDLMIFLVAFWLYNDGINSIIKLATFYGTRLKMDPNDMILALLITQFVGVPCAFAFGWLAGKIKPRRALEIGLVIYLVITVFAFWMKTETHFYLLAGCVGMVQGGTQALSRSVFGSMVPRHKMAEFFSFYGLSAKFSAILGPLLFGVVVLLTGQERFGILSVAFFFIAGLIILRFVDIDRGRITARA